LIKDLVIKVIFGKIIIKNECENNINTLFEIRTQKTCLLHLWISELKRKFKLLVSLCDTALPAEQSGQAERYWRYGGGWAAATTYIQIRQSIRMGRPAMTQKTTTATVMAIELWQYNVSKANNKLITELENQRLSSGTWILMFI